MEDSQTFAAEKLCKERNGFGLKPTMMKKIAHVAALLMLVSLLVPVIAFSATTIQSASYANDQVTAAVYSDVYDSTYGDVALHVYGSNGPNGVYNLVATGSLPPTVDGNTYYATITVPGVSTSVYSTVYLVAAYNSVTSSVYTVTTTGAGNGNGGGSSRPTGNGGGGGGSSTTSSGSTVSTDASGNVDAAALANAFASSSAVTVAITGDSAQLPASALLDASGKDGATVTISSGEGTYTLPLSLLKGLDTLAKTLGVNVSDLTIKVTIGTVSGDMSTALNSAASDSGIKLLSDAVDFNVQVVTLDGRATSIDYGNTYVSRTMNLSAAVDADHATGALYDPATQTFSFVPSTFSGNTATLKRNGNSIYAVVSTTKSFSDIGNHWAKADIQLLANKLVIDGMTDSTFAPENSITRGQFAALIVRALGLTTPATTDASFKDVKSTDWYANAVNAAAGAGLVNGYEDGTFRADNPITREELAALVVRALRYAGVATDVSAAQQAQLLAGYTDAGNIVWGQQELAAAIHAGIVNGVTDTTLGSNWNATRAQAAVMLKRLLGTAGFIN